MPCRSTDRKLDFQGDWIREGFREIPLPEMRDDELLKLVALDLKAASGKWGFAAPKSAVNM